MPALSSEVVIYAHTTPTRSMSFRRIFIPASKVTLRVAAFLPFFLAFSTEPRLHAVELPYRAVILGEHVLPTMEDLDSFERYRISFDGGYRDFYRMKSSRESHDYNLSDVHVSALLRRKRWIVGISAGREDLTLSQDNVYTDADRMSGGRSRVGSHLVLGLEHPAPSSHPAPRATRLLASIGWNDGLSASLAGRTAFSRHFESALFARTSPGSIDLAEEINGYRFPFYFPFRTEEVSGDVTYHRHSLVVSGGAGVVTSAGEGEPRQEFENRLYYRSIAYRGSARFRTQASGCGRTLYRKTHTDAIPPGMAVSVRHHDGKGDLGMYHHGVRYLYLKDLNISDTVVRVTLIPLESSWFFAGWERLSAELKTSESFFDIWPFLVWDVFEAKRYRFGPIDSHIDAWFLGLGTHLERKRFDVELEARWEWWDDTTALRWLEREDIVFPIFFRYIPHDEELDIRYRYAMQIDPAVTVKVGARASVRLSGRVTFPLGKEEKKAAAVSPPPPPPQPPEHRDAVSRHGGLFGWISFVYAF